MGVRNRGRKALLQARYAAEVGGRPVRGNLETLKGLLQDPELGLGVPLDDDDWNWVVELADTVQGNCGRILEMIEDALENWSLDRLSIITRLILEQAVGEMVFSDPPTPPAVVIDEALELAKIFDSDDSPGFINGVLDSIARGL